MKNWLYLALAGIFFTTLAPLQATAQQGLIYGNVSDQSLPLMGATVYLRDVSAIGAITDESGNFKLANVPVGSHEIVVSYIGYEPHSQVVEVQEGVRTEVKIVMKAVGFTGEEVVVTAQRRGQTQAINQQLGSDQIAAIVSADRIQELPDVNAAEAIGRLPGVSLNRSGGEGQKVVIRGMEPKFSAITINGVRLPSNSSTDRSVDLSLISPELLDGIEVFKSPLPDSDAEAIGGTVNLRLRKADAEPHFMAKGLGGYNDLQAQFMDYKGVLQASNRFFEDRLGIIAQGSIERFNRSGDFLSYGWRQGRTDTTTGITEILGRTLQTEDRQEIRRRYNASLALDYDLNERNRLSFLGLYSRTDRDQFRNIERYVPSEPAIEYLGRGIETQLALYNASLFGEHELPAGMELDWGLSTSRSLGQTPYDFTVEFFDNVNVFDSDLNQDGDPRSYLASASPDLDRTILRESLYRNTQTLEDTRTALINLKGIFKIGKKFSGEWKVGGKYYQIDRSRSVDELAEGFYYLGGAYTSDAANAYDGDLTYLPDNNDLISIRGFLGNETPASLLNQEGELVNLNSQIDPAIIKSWYEAQVDLLNEDRSAILDRYEVLESIAAGYAMLKLKWGEKFTVIPGFRYEYSDNVYQAGLSTLSGRYGVNGIYQDTTTTQQYGNFLPHLHLKFKPFEWLDIRASYAQTLARPDFAYITPRIQIDQNSEIINAGNPDLSYMKATNYDLHISAYHRLIGLFTVGVFYKDLDNIFIPITQQLVNDSTANAAGWPGQSGYQLNTYTNLPDSRAWGYELDFQTYFGFLPEPLNGLVLNANYSRLFSATEVFFLTSETKLIRPFPPILETIYTTEQRDVSIPSQPPHIFHLSLGYELKGFSARISGIYQGNQVRTYSVNKDFDVYNLSFWRWDASIKQKLGTKWSLFLNLNNITNQQDITFTRNEDYLNTIQTFGFTGTIGAQFKI
ncbi:TonB-dependent receptor domain-containing protein [Pontibacter sp. G13]|uniref:TonB-dependent receptor n=1 Tax=Pontibacter sp. G13 TaxID=3074898 RepID=UPI00288B32CE|nr:TonB-dependent receptor [Pontibacter sp. G13]WNJ15908.1 TonB-dependent receptor [Pontibacter sp. G13]